MAFAATRSIASVQGLSAKKVQGSKARVAAVRCVSEETPAVFSTRRSALSLIATGAAAVAAKPANAAYGDSANVFGKTSNKSGFQAYQGEGFNLLMPSKFNPSQERIFPNTVLQYGDNFDQVAQMTVLVAPTSKSKIEDFGSLDEFLKQEAYLLGQQTWEGDSLSEGGFRRGQTAVANLFNQQVTNRDGKNYYEYELLTRTADGNEGGKHHFFSSTVSNGKLYTLRIQIGEKRWLAGYNEDCATLLDSWRVTA